jgi:hypothetical protein
MNRGENKSQGAKTMNDQTQTPIFNPSTPPPSFFSVVLIIGASVLMGQTVGLYWFAPVVIVLYWVASINAWDPLIQLASHTGNHNEPCLLSRLSKHSTRTGLHCFDIYIYIRRKK